MIGLAAASAALKPYLVWVKVAALALVFLVGLRAGCAWQGNRDASTIAGLRADLKVSGTELRVAGEALREVSARTRAAEARALAAQQANDASVAGAREDAERFAETLIEVAGEIEAAKKDAACRAELERKPCVKLR